MNGNLGNVCANCGATFGEGEAFCTKCGAKKEIIPEKISPEEEVSANNDDAGNVCVNCGAMLGAEDVFCTNCGVKREIILEQSNHVEEAILEQSSPVKEVIAKPVDEKKGKKKTIIIIAAILSLAVIGVVVFMLVSGTPINQFKNALNSSDIEGAIVLYNENADDTKFLEKADNITKDFIANVIKDFISDIRPYAYAFNALTDIDDIAKVGKAKESLKDIKESKYYFTLAEKAVAQNDYAAALPYYNLVIEVDSPNYETAQNKISETTELLCTTALDSANESIAKGNYAAAYKILMKIDTSYTNDQLKSLLLEITPKANTEIENTAQTMIDNADYPGAYKYLDALGTDVISNKAKNIMKSAYDLFSTQKLAEAEEKATAGNYEEAANLLITAAQKINVTEFSIKATEYQIEADLQAQKVFVVSATAYDDISRKARILVKNNAEQVLKEFTVKILLFDNNGYPVKSDKFAMVGNLYSGLATAANIQPGSTSGNDRYWNIDVGVAGTKIKACIYTAQFSDGTSWTNPNYQSWLERERDQY